MENKSKQKSFKKLIFTLLFVSIAVSLFAATAMQSSAADYFSGDWGYYINSDYTATIDFCDASDDNIVVPSEIDYYKVTAIDYIAFYDDIYDSITVPETVTKIKNGAFIDMIVDVLYLPRSLEVIEEEAFDDCYISDVYYAGSKEEWNNRQQ